MSLKPLVWKRRKRQVYTEVIVREIIKHVKLRTFAKNIPFDRSFKFLMQSDNELLVSEIQTKLEVPDFVSHIKRVENDPDCEKLAHVIQHGLRVYRYGLLTKCEV